MNVESYIYSRLQKNQSTLGPMRFETPKGLEVQTPDFEQQRILCEGLYLGEVRGTLSLNRSDVSKESGIQLATELAVLCSQDDFEAALSLDQAMDALDEENPHFQWSGVYALNGEDLYLAAFRGKPSPHDRIPKSEGICGLAVRENATINIEDVHSDERYLSCDVRAQSELVVPIRNADGVVIGEIDIDSHQKAAFQASDEKRLETLALELASATESLWRP